MKNEGVTKIKPHVEAETPPSTIGRYKLLACVGQGGMAEVYKACLMAAAGAKKTVCIKRIRPRLSRSAEFTRLFVSEAKISLALTHSNIVQVFDFGEIDGNYFLAMEYVDGQNLATLMARARLRSGGIDVPTALYIAREIAAALRYAHTICGGGQKVRVVHRDVSPHNILVSYRGEVKLTDFGIAAAETSDACRGFTRRGKPGYASPEYLRGEAVDARSDIFSLGVTLYEMLSGHRPFEGKDDAETADNVKREEAPRLESVDNDIVNIVERALAKRPAERYSTSGEIQQDLTAVLRRLAPDYNGDRLSDLIKEIFVDEVVSSDEEATIGQRDRLLHQLSRAGIDVDQEGVSTGDLLHSATVSLEVDPEYDEADRGSGRRWRGILWTVAALGMVAIVSAYVLLQGAVVGNEALVDGSARQSPAFRQPDPTDHITPQSLHRIQPIASASDRSAAASGPATGAVANKNQPQGFGYINCNSWPWSYVYLDGRRISGNTPIHRMRVSAGVHRVRFVNPELGLSKAVKITLAAGSTRTIAVRLQSNADSHLMAPNEHPATPDERSKQ